MTGLVVASAVAGRVMVSHPHPNADRLRVAVVDVGKASPLRVVYGGLRDLQAGEWVPVALPGTEVTVDGRQAPKLRSRRWRGVRSEAMLCSSDELGWTVGGPDEVLVLDTPQTAGAPVACRRPFYWLYGPARRAS